MKNKERRNTFITLLWPVRQNALIFNIYPHRTVREFKLHLSNVLQHVKRRRAKKLILFVDQATYHKSPAAKRFVRNHKQILKVKLLAKRAPRLNPVEYKVNKPLKSAVYVNKSYENIDDVERETASFLKKYRRILGT